MGDGVVGYEKQPALCFPNVQAAFLLSDGLIRRKAT